MGGARSVVSRLFHRGPCKLDRSPEAVRRRKQDEMLLMFVTILLSMLTVAITVFM